MQHIFLKFFLKFPILLIINILFCSSDSFFRTFPRFPRLSATKIPENFADFWKFSAKTEF